MKRNILIRLTMPMVIAVYLGMMSCNLHNDPHEGSNDPGVHHATQGEMRDQQVMDSDRRGSVTDTTGMDTITTGSDSTRLRKSNQGH